MASGGISACCFTSCRLSCGTSGLRSQGSGSARRLCAGASWGRCEGLPATYWCNRATQRIPDVPRRGAQGCHQRQKSAVALSALDPIAESNSNVKAPDTPAPAKPAPAEDDPVLRARFEKKAAWAAQKVTLGEKLVDVLFVFGGLLDRPFGTGQSIAAAGAVVVEKVRSEVNSALPRGQGGTNSDASASDPPSESPLANALGADSPEEEQKKVQICFEILRQVQLLAFDLELMKAAVKEETLLPRLEQAKIRCREAMILARQL